MTIQIHKALLALGVVFFSLFWPMAASAGGGGGAPEPMVFTLNVGDKSYVQFGLIFETGTSEALHEVQVYKPKIQHEIILLMSGKDEGRLRTLEGKKALVEEIIDLGNHIIHEDRETGIKEVLFTKFLIQ